MVYDRRSRWIERAGTSAHGRRWKIYAARLLNRGHHECLECLLRNNLFHEPYYPTRFVSRVGYGIDWTRCVYDEVSESLCNDPRSSSSSIGTVMPAIPSITESKENDPVRRQTEIHG